MLGGVSEGMQPCPHGLPPERHVGLLANRSIREEVRIVLRPNIGHNLLQLQ